MRYILPALLVTILASCKETASKLTAKITDSDSMAINWFKGDGTMDTVIAVKMIRDKAAINSLAKMAGGAVQKGKNCGYDGSLHFFKASQVIQDIRFRMNDAACTQFEFILEHQPYTTALNEEAKKLLESLRR